MHARDWLLAFIGFFLPPIPVLIKRGFFSSDFWINIALCLLGFIPGLIHSWYIISQFPYHEGYTGLSGGSNNYGSV